ncbi:WD40-repeat-containing domain protein, partial [Jimgerdemannia flammicorona]
PIQYISTIVKDEAHQDGIWSVAWSRNTNLVITGSADNTVNCWDGNSSTLKCTLKGHQLGVISVDVNARGTGTNRLIWWPLLPPSTRNFAFGTLRTKASASKPSTPGQVRVPLHMSIFIRPFSHHPQHSRFAITLCAHRCYFLCCFSSVASHSAEAWAVKFSPDGQYLAAGSHKGDLNIWGVESGAKELTLQTRKKFLLCTAYVRIDRCLEKLG